MTILKTDIFNDWRQSLRDKRAVYRIQIRIKRLSQGNYGDCKPVGEGISEMRIHYGGGYRVYFKSVGNTIVVLLCGGDKSTQAKDIERAKEIAETLEIETLEEEANDG